MQDGEIGILGRFALQVVGNGLGLRGIACESRGNGCSVIDFAIGRQQGGSTWLVDFMVSLLF
jgi:hypothetical protein